jgi:hypothetical protein
MKAHNVLPGNRENNRPEPFRNRKEIQQTAREKRIVFS